MVRSSLVLEEAKKGKNRREMRVLFQRACEAVKQLFPCCDPHRVQPPKAEPDPDRSKLVLPEQVSADLQSSPEEEAPSEIQTHDAVLSGSESGPVSMVSETAPDTVLPDTEIQLLQGESLLLCIMLFSLHRCFVRSASETKERLQDS